MTTKSKPLSEADAISAIDVALSSLPDDDSRTRVLDWALAKFSVAGAVRPTRKQGDDSGMSRASQVREDAHGAEDNFGSRTHAWMKKHKISSDMIDAAFHIDGENSSIIVKSVPGKSKRERVASVAALLGALSLVRTDQPKFSADELREALKQYDAYDRPNNATYVKAHKSIIQGTGTDGYTVTSVGLDNAAALLRTEPEASD